MRRILTCLLTLAALGALGFPQAVSADEGIDRPSGIEHPAGIELKEKDAKVQKVMCSWLAYGSTQFMCLEPPLPDAKKICDKKVSEERGEKAECACTADPNYIKDMCD